MRIYTNPRLKLKGAFNPSRLDNSGIKQGFIKVKRPVADIPADKRAIRLFGVVELRKCLPSGNVPDNVFTAVIGIDNHLNRNRSVKSAAGYGTAYFICYRTGIRKYTARNNAGICHFAAEGAAGYSAKAVYLAAEGTVFDGSFVFNPVLKKGNSA